MKEDDSNFITSITIPQFITRVQISKKRRAKYYSKYKGKGAKKKVPKKYRGDKYSYNKNGWLVNEHGKRMLANPRVAGKPRYQVLSGNKLLSGYGSPHVRAKLVRELRKFYRPFVQDHIDQHGSIEKFPIRVEWDCYTVVEDDPNWDAGNLFFYYKYFEDALHKDHEDEPDKYKALIPEDSVRYITHPAMPKIIPVDNWEDRKFEFKFYYDDRKELKRSPWVSDDSDD